MNKRFLVTLMVSAMMMSMVGCQSEEATGTKSEGKVEETAQKQEESTEEPEEVTLTWLHHFDEKPMCQWIDEVTAAYTKQNPHVTINVQSTGFDNYFSLLKTKISAEDAPDIFDLQALGTNLEFVDNDYLMDLSDTVVAERLVETAIDGGTHEGTLYLIPYEQSGFGVFYNKASFEKAGITKEPATYDEFLTVCKQLEDAGIIPLGQSYADLWTLICDYFTDNLVSQPAALEGWHDKMPKREAKFVDNAGDIKGTWERLKERFEYGQPDQFASDWNTITNKVATGEIGMVLNGTWTPGNIIANAPDVEIGTFAFPYSNNPEDNKYPMGATSGFVGFKGSEHQDVIIDFFDFMTQPEQAKGLAEARSSISIVKDVVPEVDPTLAEIISEYVETDKISSMSTITRDFPGEFQDVYFEVMSEYLLTDLTIDDAMAKLDKEFDRIAATK